MLWENRSDRYKTSSCDYYIAHKERVEIIRKQSSGPWLCLRSGDRTGRSIQPGDPAFPSMNWGRLESSMGSGKLGTLNLSSSIPIVKRENPDSYKLSSVLSTSRLWHECYTHRHRHTRWALSTSQHWLMDNNSQGCGKRISVGAKGGRGKAWVGITSAESEEMSPHKRRTSFWSSNPRECQLILRVSGKHF